VRPFSTRQFGKQAPTKAALSTALRSVLTMRRHGKALSPSDVASLARSYGATEAQVVAAAREAGCGVEG
jgi:hypothetical protein